LLYQNRIFVKLKYRIFIQLIQLYLKLAEQVNLQIPLRSISESIPHKSDISLKLGKSVFMAKPPKNIKPLLRYFVNLFKLQVTGENNPSDIVREDYSHN
jgi:hypothetical protein